MEIDFINLGYHVLASAVVIFTITKFNRTIVENVIDKTTKPIITDIGEIKVTLDEHGVMIKHNSIRLDKYAVGDNFHFDVDKAVKSGLEILGADIKPASYVIKMGEYISNFYREVMVDGIENDKKAVVINRIEAKMGALKNILCDLLGEKYCIAYFEKYEPQKKEFIYKISNIATGQDNNKDDRFRITTLDFIQNRINDFVRYYLTEGNIFNRATLHKK